MYFMLFNCKVTRSGFGNASHEQRMGAEPFLSGSFDDSSGANLDLHDLAESGVGDSYAERGTLSKRTVKASVRIR